MGLADWFKITSFYGKIVRDMGTVKVSKGSSSMTVRLRELSRSLHTGERRYLMTLSMRSFLSWSSVDFPLTEAQARQLAGLFADAQSEPAVETVPGAVDSR